MSDKADMPRIGITMGDPAGIGPEIILKALANTEVATLCHPILYADIAWMRRTAVWLGSALRLGEGAGAVGVRQASDADLSGVRPGELSAAAGKAAAECVLSAARDALEGEIDAIVTAPINKQAIALGGYPYPGHTEMLATATGAAHYGMLLLSGPLRVVHVSTHVSLRQAIERVKAPRIWECIRLGDRACRQLGLAAPRVAVAGLNPHAGEIGMFGNEEAEEIAPAIARARAEGIDASGPYPPDTVFARALRAEFDLVVAMYHDQGHIPVKLNGFDCGVNVTIGLPIIRTSVDHGTAFDIAGQGIAGEASLIEAIRVAATIVNARHKEAPA